MTYWLDVHSPKGWEESITNCVSGWSEYRHQQKALSQIQCGDILVCYMAGKCLWCGALKVRSLPYYCNKHIYSTGKGTYPWCVSVSLIPTNCSIDVRKTINILELFQNNLQFWYSFLRTAPRRLSDHDGESILQMLNEGVKK